LSYAYVVDIADFSDVSTYVADMCSSAVRLLLIFWTYC